MPPFKRVSLSKYRKQAESTINWAGGFWYYVETVKVERRLRWKKTIYKTCNKSGKWERHFYAYQYEQYRVTYDRYIGPFKRKRVHNHVGAAAPTRRMQRG